MTPLLPCHSKRGCATTLGWLASTSIAALLVSGLAAWAMVYRDDGTNSVGDAAVEILLISAPIPSFDVISEPSPDVASSAPQIATTQEEEVTEPPPELPQELAEPNVPQLPDLAPQLPDLVDNLPQVESEIPLPMAAKVPEPKPEPEEKPEPKKPEPKKAEKKPEKKPAPKDKPKERQKAEKQQEAAPDRAASKGSSASQAASSQGAAGQKAIANYGASVLKKVNRTKKRNAGARGQTVVGFKIASNGALESAWVISSSGKEKLDSVALDHIRRSAPFEAPPAGAQRSFSFTFVGK